MHPTRRLLIASALTAGLAAMFAARAQQDAAPVAPSPLRGEHINRSTFPNRHAHIPGQCYTETGGGTQNACQFCHTDGVADLGLGNNNPQAGRNPNVGNLQESYAFGVYDYPHVVNSSVNPWENTLHPERLREIAVKLGATPDAWDMQAYVRQGNWQAAYDARPRPARGSAATDWDTGVDGPFRLFPALSPADLPAQADGFVRTQDPARGLYRDAGGWVTGWRALNFMPYGIFTPQSGSVSGVYIRLPRAFMQNAAGQDDPATYARNLDLVQRGVQDRLNGEKAYLGGARDVKIERGQYPLGTEFAHPLHYVDVQADGTSPEISRFPGTRAERVKEIRWMYKVRDWHPDEFGLSLKEESAPVYTNRTQGWVENGAGWMLGGWIEDARGQLRAQTPSELTQCVACHSGNARPSDVGQNAVFTSGTGNTVDSTWAMPRQFRGRDGWKEMDYLGYRAHPHATAGSTPGTLATSEPLNRVKNVGEYRYFLDHVVGASLYGDMPAAMDALLKRSVTQARGYSADWPDLAARVSALDAAGVLSVQQQRQTLMREFTARGEHLDAAGRLKPELFLPTAAAALDSARLYRQVVVTQRYDFGKDVFAQTPFTLRYFRTAEQAFPHQDGRAYRVGEVITDRPVDPEPSNFTYGIGETATLIDEQSSVTDYVPLLK